MDDYLQCLFEHISERLFLDARIDLLDYNRWNAQREAAWDALKKELTHEQLALVEEYQSACNGKRLLEEQLLFQAAVDLGRRMARP